MMVESGLETADFMAKTYDRIEEPLNLLEGGQAWFTHQYLFHSHGKKHDAMILGGTPWLAELCLENHEKVHLVDMSKEMLKLAKQRVSCGEGSERLLTHCLDWTMLKSIDFLIDTACGDNSFSFIRKEKWEGFMAALHQKMRTRGLLISRFFSVPETYTHMTREELIRYSSAAGKVNFTEMRCRMMFTELDREEFVIPTEKVVGQYLANKAAYQSVSKGQNIEETKLNDILKYRNTDICLYVPPISRILKTLSPFFKVLGVSYGPYIMSEYFPLVVAEKR